MSSIRRESPVKTRSAIAMAAAACVALIATLSGCGGGDDSDAGGGGGGGKRRQLHQHRQEQGGPPVVTMWAWYPNMDKVVDNFNDAHDDVQVCWTNAGAGGDEYDKFQTAVSAGKGAPDVMMVEADRSRRSRSRTRSSTSTTSATRTWRPTSARGLEGRLGRATASTAPPSTGVPWAMIYRTDIFDQYGITPPTTWEEPETAAQTVKDAGGPVFATSRRTSPPRPRRTSTGTAPSPSPTTPPARARSAST